MPFAFFSCGPKPGEHPDFWMVRGLVDTGEDQEAEMVAADKKDRLMCDCCQQYQPSHLDLRCCGGDMLCDGCANE